MGYETPVEMPSMGIYNTDLMKMYIAGVKDQYEKGQEEMKDFMKLYGDFYSDIPGATEAYNNMTIVGARDMINQMLANGIDPYKSPEARAAISRYIASVPTSALNIMKRSAENAKAYKQMEAKMKANGTWGSDDFQRAMLGGKLLDEWDPNTPFTATSPYEYKSLYELALPQFAKFGKTEDLGPGSRPFYRKYGISDPNIASAIEGTVASGDSSAYGKYYRDQARNAVMQKAAADGMTLTPDQLDKLTELQYRQNIRDVMTDYLQPEEKPDNVGLTMWKEQMDAQQHALNRATQLNIAQMRANNNPTSNDRTPLSRQIIESSNVKSAATTLKNFRQHIDDPEMMKFVGMSRQAVEKMNNKTLLKEGLKDRHGQWTAKATALFKILDANTLNDKKFIGGGNPNERRNKANKIYSQWVAYDMTGSPELSNRMSQILSGNSDKVQPAGEYGKVYAANSSDRNFTPTGIRRTKLLGSSNMLSKWEIAWAKYLKNNPVQMFKHDPYVNVAGVPKASGKSSIDVFGNFDIDYSYFENFCKFMGVNDNKQRIKLRQMLGLQVYNATNQFTETKTTVKNSKDTEVPNKLGKKMYVRVPMTRTILPNASGSYENTPFDLAYEKLFFGQSEASKAAEEIEEYSLGDLEDAFSLNP